MSTLPVDNPVVEFKLRQLDLSHADLRIVDSASQSRLVLSIEARGQLLPVVVVREGGRHVLVDGFARVRALRRLGKDTATALVLARSEAEAMLWCYHVTCSCKRSNSALHQHSAYATAWQVNSQPDGPQEATMVISEYEQQGYRISTDSADIDIDAVHAYLARSYWAREIPKELVAKSVRGSLCFGLFKDDRQVGFARVITDRATFAYLCDVYVLEDCRGQGLGKWLIGAVVAHPDLQGLRRFVLATRDAHGLYERYGFAKLQRPDTFMEIDRKITSATGA